MASEQLNRIFSELKNKNEDARINAAKGLNTFISNQVRELTPDAIGKLISDLNTRISALVNSPNTHEKAGAISAIEELISIDYEETEIIKKIAKFEAHIRIALDAPDNQIVFQASRALGKIVHIGGSLSEISETVDNSLKRALDGLNQERNEPRRYAAVLMLKELAMNTPSLFNNHVSLFMDQIWIILSDPTERIRDTGVEALKAALSVISEREQIYSAALHKKLWTEVDKRLQNKDINNPGLVAALLVIGELLTNSGDFMDQHYKEVGEVVFRIVKDSTKLKRYAVYILPKLAQYSSKLFLKEQFLNSAITFLKGEITKKDGGEKPKCFLSIGDIALSMKSQIKPYLDAIMMLVKGAIQTKKKVDFVQEALVCLSSVAQALGPTARSHIQDLLPDLFNGGLNDLVVDTLTTFGKFIPGMKTEIQEILLNTISNVVGYRPVSDEEPKERTRTKSSSTSATHVRALSVTNSMEHMWKEDPATLIVALRTLSTFSFQTNTNVKSFNFYLEELVKECIIKFVDNDDPQIRNAAAIACASLLANNSTGNKHVIAEVLDSLLTLAITERESYIRKAIFASLSNPRFEEIFAEPSFLKTLFLALNDEQFEVREQAVAIIGRLTTKNPAHVMPSLRKTMIQFLGDLQFSGESKKKEESAKLLAQLLRSSHKLITPYVETITKVLLPKLTQENSHVSSYVLGALGELSIAGRKEIKKYLDIIMPVIIDTLIDQTSATKREVALRALGKICSYTGYVINPILDFPNLYETLLNLVKTEHTKGVRRELIKTIGILGSLDPYKYKLNQRKLLGLHGEEGATGKKDKREDVEYMTINASNLESYYPSVAINTLVKLLKDPSLTMLHRTVIITLIPLMKGLGPARLKPFLPVIIPPFLEILKQSGTDTSFLIWLFQELSVIVSIVKSNIKEYVDEIFRITSKNWNQTGLLIQIITLVEDICVELKEDFKAYLPDLIPQLLKVLFTDQSQKYSGTRKVLHALETFGPIQDDYLHLVIPSILSLFEQNPEPEIHKLALVTLSRLSKHLNFSDFSSRIVHAVVRVLDNPLPDVKLKEQYAAQTEIRREALDFLCSLIFQLRSDFAIFIPMINRILSKHSISDSKYDNLVSRLMKNLPLMEANEAVDTAPLKTDRKNTEVSEPMNVTQITLSKHKVNVAHLKTFWEISSRTTKDDWAEWIRRLSVGFLRESPSPALRSCHSLAQDYFPLVRELFNAGFVSCWSELEEKDQQDLVKSLEAALTSPTIPLDILQTLLNLAEFMEHQQKPLPIPKKKLIVLAEKCQAFAKALYYREEEFLSEAPSMPMSRKLSNPNEYSDIEGLISVYAQLEQPQASEGIVSYVQKIQGIQPQDTWWEKLQKYDQALEFYSKKTQSQEILFGQARCLYALGEWESLHKITGTILKTLSADELEPLKPSIAKFGAAACFNSKNWGGMPEFLDLMPENSFEGGFYRAALEVQNQNFESACKYIEGTRQLLDSELTTLLGESYQRAYPVLVKLQQLNDLEEVIEHMQLSGDVADAERKSDLCKLWGDRLLGVQRNVDTWRELLAVQSMVLPPSQNPGTWLKFASLCRKSKRIPLAGKILVEILGAGDHSPSNSKGTLRSTTGPDPRISFAYIKHLYAGGNKEHKDAAFDKLKIFCATLRDDPHLQSRAFQKLGEWQLTKESLEEKNIPAIVSNFKSATDYDPSWYKGWRSWGLVNFQVVSHYEAQGVVSENMKSMLSYLLPALRAFLKSISLSKKNNLQDTLRLLTLWFKFGNVKEVESLLVEGFGNVPIETWLQVVPQLIARIAAPSASIRTLVRDLLISVGKEHPQALVFTLNVALKSQYSPGRATAAKEVLLSLRKNSPQLLEQAQMVSQELVRVAIVWHEVWFEALEEAAKINFSEHDPDRSIERLKPLHHMIEGGGESVSEIGFYQQNSRDLQEAQEWVNRYRSTKQPADLSQAWDLYYQVFLNSKQYLLNLTSIHLQYTSPKLVQARDLLVAMPGTYRAGEPTITINSFIPELEVMNSKQHPRKLTIRASDGDLYRFLLKGHEDLRQDERVMQLFGLVNTLLANEFVTSREYLSIQRYSVIPLAPNSGLIGWVPHCDTFHSLIRAYRDAQKIPLTLEHRILTDQSSDHHSLCSIQKVELLKAAMASTDGMDLKKVLWWQSETAELWLERRTNFTKTVAVMSMIGYILGLGDRHCSNIMIDRISGRVVHIDFGDCFEVAMHREKFPERIPFRLTRMMCNAMGPSGIEGNFKTTCENVMRVLHQNKDSLMAVLEAFVYDPLISWRLVTTEVSQDKSNFDENPFILEDDDDFGSQFSKYSSRSVVSRSGPIEIQEVLNEKAVEIIKRISNKLTGNDFSAKETLPVNAQVQKLIKQATDVENLAQCYTGWSPYW